MAHSVWTLGVRAELVGVIARFAQSVQRAKFVSLERVELGMDFDTPIV